MQHEEPISPMMIAKSGIRMTKKTVSSTSPHRSLGGMGARIVAVVAVVGGGGGGGGRMAVVAAVVVAGWRGNRASHRIAIGSQAPISIRAPQRAPPALRTHRV